jgi:hypothetical protein
MKFIKSLKGEDDGTTDAPVMKAKLGKGKPAFVSDKPPMPKDKGQFNLPPSDRLLKKSKRGF